MRQILKRYKFYILIFILSVIPLYSLFFTDLIYTQDGYAHLVRGAAYFKAISNFDIPPRWAGELNYGYGMPLFIFVFQLPYQLFSILIALGLSLAGAFKVLIFSSFLISGITMYLFSKEFFKNSNTAFFVTILYQFFPYRFVDLIIRGSIGEAFAFAFFPLLLLGIIKLNSSKTIGSYLLIILGTSALLLSHLATGGVFIGISILFSVFFLRRIKLIIQSIAVILFGFFIAGYYIFPAIIEHKYTYGDLFARNLFIENLVPFEKLFSLSLLNTPLIRIGDVPVNLGIPYLFILFFLVIALLRYNKMTIQNKKIILFSAIVVFGSILMMLSVSKPIWENTSLLRQFQFPWRFLAPLGFALSFIGGLIAGYFLKKRVLVYILIFIILTSISFWVPILGYKQVDEKYYWDFPLTTTYFGETDVIWSAGPAQKFPKNRVEFASGTGIISEFAKTNSSQRFTINAKEISEVVSHTQYFPGWVVRIDGKKEQIQFQNPNHRGEILFSVPRGEHEIQIKFEESKVRYLSNIITVLSIVLLFPFILIIRKFL